MKHLFIFLVALVVTLLTAATATWSQPGSRNTDVKHIALDLHFDWQKKKAIGTAVISLSLLHPASRVDLDAVKLEVNSISLANGTPLKFEIRDQLSIVLDHTYSPNEDITLKIDYGTNWVNTSDPNNIWGSAGKGLRFLGPTSTEPKRRKQIWSMGEPEANRHWFPGNDVPNDLRTTEIKITVEQPLTAISNGTLLSTKSNTDGTRTFHWKLGIPYPNQLTSLVVGEYVDVAQKRDDIQLHNFCYPDEAEATTATVVRLPDMVKYFSEMTGVKYPYTGYSQIFVQDFPGWTSNATASTITENMVDDDRTHDDFYYLWDITEGEALAGQWFGNLISISNWSDLWLNKAFAQYFSGLYNEHRNGRDEYLLYQHRFNQNTYLGDWNAGVRQPVVDRNFKNPEELFGSNTPYFHGASVLHMLRGHLGEEKWWKAIRIYVSTYAGKQVTTEDFQKAVETASGEPMQWFFDQWVYKPGHPIFKISKKYDENQKQLTLTVQQTQKLDSAAHSQTEFFQGKVDIEIDSRIETVMLQPKAENVFTWPTPQKPRLVSFDYEGTWIKEMVFEKDLDEMLYQLQNDKGIVGKRWAMSELTKMARNERTASADKAKIYAGLRTLISSNAYWRIRAHGYAVLQSLLTPADGKPAKLDQTTLTMLQTQIKTEKAWVKTAAISLLGTTQDAKYADIYLTALNDPSDRVINAAAVALGQSKSPKAFDALVKLKDKPSWKNQSLISTLNGLRELGDPRAVPLVLHALTDSESPHWTLATPVWDHRLAAAQTLVALGKANEGYPLILAQFKKALVDNDINDIFYNVLQVNTLADPRGQEVYDELKLRFKDEEFLMAAVVANEAQFKEAVGKK